MHVTGTYLVAQTGLYTIGHIWDLSPSGQLVTFVLVAPDVLVAFGLVASHAAESSKRVISIIFM